MAATASQGILGDDAAEDREQIVEMLKKAYFMELETVMSYITNSVNPDGILAREIAESLSALGIAVFGAIGLLIARIIDGKLDLGALTGRSSNRR